MADSAEVVCEGTISLSRGGVRTASLGGTPVCEPPFLYSLLNGDWGSDIHPLPELLGNAPFK